MLSQGFSPGPLIVGAVLGVLREVTGALVPGYVHDPVQQFGPPFKVGQALIQRGACVVLGIVQQADQLSH